MSALPSAITITAAAPTLAAPAQPAPRGAEWLSVQDAAERMGVSVRRIAQLAASKWAALELARRVGTGAGKWEVRDDAHPQLARVLFPESMPFDWSQLTAGQRGDLQQRVAIVKAWGEARAAGFRGGLSVEKSTFAFLHRVEQDHGLKLSASALYTWYQKWRAEGVGGLVDGRWKERSGDEEDEFLAEARRWYLMKGKEFSVRDCWVMAQGEAHRRGWAVRSYDQVKRCLARVPRAVAIRQRQGDEAWVNECEPFGQRDYSTIASNDWWNADHHIFDCLVRSPNGKLMRPWLTVWQDVRSRKIVGCVIRCADPNSDAVLAAFRNAAVKHGVPNQVLVDNGRDFKAFTGGRQRKLRVDHDKPRITSTLESLGVGAVHCQPYHPQAKPVERWFRTLEEGFGAWWATYTGSSPADKPEALAANVKAGKAPTLAQFAAAFEKWLDVGYHQRPHFGDAMHGRTPAAVFDDCLVEKRTTTRESLDVLCLRPTKPLKVTQNGVRVDGLSYYHLDLVHDHLGKLVTVRVDDTDRSRVLVFTQGADRFLCVAECRRKLPWKTNSQEFREGQAEKGKLRRKAREFMQEVRPRVGEDVVDTMLRNRAIVAEQQAAEHPVPEGPGPVIRPVRSPFEDQLPAIASAMNRQEHRQAAGAETVPALSAAQVSALLRKGVREPVAETPASIDLLRSFSAARSEAP